MNHIFSLSKVSEPSLSLDSMAETRLDQLKETIDDKQANIGDRIHALLLLLRSRKAKEENHEDKSPNDKELVEMEVATESIEAEHGTVKREANASMILANLEDESMPPFQVPVSDSKIWRNVEKIEVEGDVERGQKVQSMEKIYSAHQVFGKMSQHETLGLKKKTKTFLKTWRFKFKEQVQPRQLIQEKLRVHEANATKNQLWSPIGLVVDDLHGCGSDIFCVQYFVSSVVAGDFQETQWLFNDELQDIKKFQIVIEEDSNSYVYQEFSGMRIRSHMLHHQRKPSKSPKSWKFKFKSENLRKMEVKVLDNREVVVGVVGIRQVMSVTKPVTIKQQRGFLGLSGYYRRFVQHFGSIASLLYALSKKDSFIGSLQAQEVFNKLKLALYQDPILALPLFDRPLIVETEAYGKGIGVVFMQDGHPIEYNSRQANSTLLPTILQDTVVKKPELVLDRRMVNRQGKTATKVLVKWTNETIEEATWEVSLIYRSDFQHKNLEDKVLRRREI